MKKTLLSGFILIALSLSFSIAQANFSVLYDWLWGPKEEIKQEAEDPTVGFVYNPVYFKKIGNDIQIINSSWGFIVGNATTTGTSDLATTTVSGDFTVNNQTSTSTINIYSEAADFGGSIIKEKEDGSGCTEQWSGSDGLEYFSNVSCP